MLQPEIAFIIKVSEARYAAQIAALEAANPGINPVLGPVGSFGLEWPIAGIVTEHPRPPKTATIVAAGQARRPVRGYCPGAAPPAEGAEP